MSQPQNIGDADHKAQFLSDLRRETQENIWKNDLHLMRLNDELELAQGNLEKLNAQLEAKGKKPAAAEAKQKFVFERSIALKQKEIATVTETRDYNDYLLNSLIPRYEKS